MEVKIVCKEGYEPKYETAGASGIDLKATEDVTIDSGSFRAINLSLRVAIPQGYEMQIRPRSGLMFKLGVVGGLGTIDSDYRGEVKACLFNFGDEQFIIHKGDRVCQAVFCKIEKVNLVRVTEEEFLQDKTERGSGGFGSTVVK